LQRCFSLPRDMQPANLSADKLMPTPSLPARDWSTERAQRFRVGNPSSRTENPVVDPTVGPGRTQNAVRRETAAYREACRAKAAELTPVFMADYLFVQLPGVPLALHSVCHGQFLQERAVRPSVRPHDRSSTPSPPVCLSVCLSACLSACLSVCLSV
jgi:hypothetical protein